MYRLDHLLFRLHVTLSFNSKNVKRSLDTFKPINALDFSLRYDNMIHSMHVYNNLPQTIKCTFTCMIPNIYNWRCTVAASSNIGVISMYEMLNINCKMSK